MQFVTCCNYFKCYNLRIYYNTHTKAIFGIFVWIQFRLKKFNKYDAFGIYKQLWISSILFFIFEIIANIATAIGTAWFWYDEEYWIIYYYWQTIYFFVILYFEVPSIERLRKQMQQQVKTIIKEESRGIIWNDIVTTPFGYSSFMNHLELEWSLENLLFITEYIQIKDILLEQNINIKDNLLSLKRPSSFHVNIPYQHEIAIDIHNINNNNINNNNIHSSNNNNYSYNKHSHNNINIDDPVDHTIDDISSPDSFNNGSSSNINIGISSGGIGGGGGGGAHHRRAVTEDEIVYENELPAGPASLHKQPSMSRSKISVTLSRMNSRRKLKGSHSQANSTTNVFHQFGIDVPQSSIVNQFLINKNNNNNHNNHNNNNNNNNNSSDNINISGNFNNGGKNGQGIINAFCALYSKYIDAVKAPLMINISDYRRKKLEKLLDKEYYHHIKHDLKKTKNKSLTKSGHDGGLNNVSGSYSVTLNVHNVSASSPSGDRIGNRNRDTNDVETKITKDGILTKMRSGSSSPISPGNNSNNSNSNDDEYDLDFGTAGSMVNVNVNVGDRSDASIVSDCVCLVERQWKEKDCSMEWLLDTLFQDMDVAANEIGRLMMDSFHRFRNQNPQVFAKALKLAKKVAN